MLVFLICREDATQICDFCYGVGAACPRLMAGVCISASWKGTIVRVAFRLIANILEKLLTCIPVLRAPDAYGPETAAQGSAVEKGLGKNVKKTFAMRRKNKTLFWPLSA